MDVTFEVPGQPIGYYASGFAPNWSRRLQYHTYKKKVQRFAKRAGLKLPLVATYEKPVFIFTVSVFSDHRHSDPPNVEKGVADALFYTTKRKGAADKFTGNASAPPAYDEENPRLMVRVSDENFFAFKAPRKE